MGGRLLGSGFVGGGLVGRGFVGDMLVGTARLVGGARPLEGTPVGGRLADVVV